MNETRAYYKNIVDQLDNISVEVPYAHAAAHVGGCLCVLCPSACSCMLGMCAPPVLARADTARSEHRRATVRACGESVPSMAQSASSLNAAPSSIGPCHVQCSSASRVLHVVVSPGPRREY